MPRLSCGVYDLPHNAGECGELSSCFSSFPLLSLSGPWTMLRWWLWHVVQHFYVSLSQFMRNTCTLPNDSGLWTVSCYTVNQCMTGIYDTFCQRTYDHQNATSSGDEWFPCSYIMGFLASGSTCSCMDIYKWSYPVYYNTVTLSTHAVWCTNLSLGFLHISCPLTFSQMLIISLMYL